MFDLGWSKLLILAVIAIVVVGPQELPGLLRAVGRFVAQLRRHAAEFRTQFDEAIRDTGIDEIRRDVAAIKTDTEASLRGLSDTLEADIAKSKHAVEDAVAAVEAKPLDAPPATAQASLPGEVDPFPTPDYVAATVATSSAEPAVPQTAGTAVASPTLPDLALQPMPHLHALTPAPDPERVLVPAKTDA